MCAPIFVQKQKERSVWYMGTDLEREKSFESFAQPGCARVCEPRQNADHVQGTLEPRQTDECAN